MFPGRENTLHIRQPWLEYQDLELYTYADCLPKRPLWIEFKPGFAVSNDVLLSVSAVLRV